MTILGRWLRRALPERVGPRLALTVAGLFLLAGGVLLGLTYGLVAASLPGGATPSGTTRAASSSKAAHAQAFCNEKVGPIVKGRARENEFKGCLQNAFDRGVNAGRAAQRDATLTKLLTYSLIGLGVMTCVSGGLGWLVSRRVLAPVRSITTTARRASQEHLGERLALTGPRDELRELADTFDDMLERLDRAFAAQRQFVANASHELRTPLTAMRTAIDVTLAKPAPTPAQLTDMAVRVRRSIDKAQQMVDALLTLAVSERGCLRGDYLDLSVLAEDALELAGPAIGSSGLRVESELGAAAVRGDGHLMERLVWNLIDNAVRHNEPGGWVRLSTGLRDGLAFLEIANSGPVVPDGALAGLLEPFQRLAERSAGKDGFGLGLSIALSVCVAHGATMDVDNPPAGGLHILVQMAAARPVLAEARP